MIICKFNFKKVVFCCFLLFFVVFCCFLLFLVLRLGKRVVVEIVLLERLKLYM